MLSLRSLSFALAAWCANLPACDLAPRVTVDPAREQWSELGPKAKTRLGELRARQAVLGGRVASLNLPAGIDDPPLLALIADLQGKLSELEGIVAALDQSTSQVAVDIDATLQKRDKIAARRAVDAGRARLDQGYAAALSPFDQLEQRLPEAESATSRHLATVAAEDQRLVRIATEGGDIDLAAVRFQGAQLDLANPGSRASLDRLLRFGSACERLRVTVTAHVDGFADASGKVLALARAEAVKAFLIASGIPADRVATGPDPERVQGREHVKVTVGTPCPPPGQAEPAGARVVPAGVPQPAMPPPPVPVPAPVPAPVVERVPQPTPVTH